MMPHEYMEANAANKSREKRNTTTRNAEKQEYLPNVEKESD